MEDNINTGEQVEAPEVQEAQAFEDNAESVNIQNMREAKEAAERVAREQAEELERLRSMQTRQEMTKPKSTPNLLGEEDLVEGRDFNKVSSKLEDLQKKMRETEKITTNAQLNMEHPDYQKVMSKKNIDILVKQYPEVAESLDSNPNLYTQHKSAYRMIKALGIYNDEVPAQQKVDINQKNIINKNMAKPIPTNSIGSKSTTSPLSQVNLFANGVTDDVRKQLRDLNKKASMNY